jgi:hypothetical protein
MFIGSYIILVIIIEVMTIGEILSLHSQGGKAPKPTVEITIALLIVGIIKLLVFDLPVFIIFIIEVKLVRESIRKGDT